MIAKENLTVYKIRMHDPLYNGKIKGSIEPRDLTELEKAGILIRRISYSFDLITILCALTKEQLKKIQERYKIDSITELTSERFCDRKDLFMSFTDGSINPLDNNGPGCGACITLKNGLPVYKHSRLWYEGVLDINIIELLAAVDAIEFFLNSESITKLLVIYTDNMFVNKLLSRKNYLKKVREALKEGQLTFGQRNVDKEEVLKILNKVEEYIGKINLYVGWVRSHAEIDSNIRDKYYYNNKVDALCRESLLEYCLEYAA